MIYPRRYIGDLNAYVELRRKGIYPLREWTTFYVRYDLRIFIQNKLFGKTELGNFYVPQANQKYYEYCYNTSLKVCEECGLPLHEYSARYVSHILSRGAHPNLAHDVRNHNILCSKHHHVWENGNRKGMKIYTLNKIIINELIQDNEQIHRR